MNVLSATSATLALLISPALVFGQAEAQPAASSTLTLNITGTLGPILSGSDPLGGNGDTFTLQALASGSLKPTKTTANSATYTLPAGAVSGSVGTFSYTTTSPSTMVVTLSSTADVITIQGAAPLSTEITGTASLAPGSFSSTILTHITAFAPTPQTLTSATTASGAGSKAKYCIAKNCTVLGLTGSATNSVTKDTVLDEDPQF